MEKARSARGVGGLGAERGGVVSHQQDPVPSLLAVLRSGQLCKDRWGSLGPGQTWLTPHATHSQIR